MMPYSRTLLIIFSLLAKSFLPISAPDDPYIINTNQVTIEGSPTRVLNENPTEVDKFFDTAPVVQEIKKILEMSDTPFTKQDIRLRTSPPLTNEQIKAFNRLEGGYPGLNGTRNIDDIIILTAAKFNPHRLKPGKISNKTTDYNTLLNQYALKYQSGFLSKSLNEHRAISLHDQISIEKFMQYIKTINGRFLYEGAPTAAVIKILRTEYANDLKDKEDFKLINLITKAHQYAELEKSKSQNFYGTFKDKHKVEQKLLSREKDLITTLKQEAINFFSGHTHREETFTPAPINSTTKPPKRSIINRVTSGFFTARDNQPPTARRVQSAPGRIIAENQGKSPRKEKIAWEDKTQQPNDWGFAHEDDKANSTSSPRTISRNSSLGSFPPSPLPSPRKAEKNDNEWDFAPDAEPEDKKPHPGLEAQRKSRFSGRTHR